jgi:DNA-binding GntR family transcriptional regulator
LNQAELAQRFGLSRIPMREALRLLVAEGYVTYRPNRGAIVSQLAPGDIEEIIEIRECLEVRLLEACRKRNREVVERCVAAEYRIIRATAKHFG